MNPALFLAMAMVLLCEALPLSTEAYSREAAATSSCPQNFTCGNMSLKFPFADLQNYNCGLCVLDCSITPFPKISLQYPEEQWLVAESINDSSSTMRLRSERLQFLLGNQSCDSFKHQIRPPTSPSISVTMLNNITLYRCQNQSQIHQSFPGFGSYGGCDDHIIFYNKHPNSSNLPAGGIGPLCSAIHLPYNNSFSPHSRSDDDVPQVFRLLGAEFDLQWHLSGGVCPNNQCSQPQEPRFFNAQNSHGGGKKRSRAFLLMGLIAGGIGLLTCSLICLYKFRRSFDLSTLILEMKTTKGRDLEAFTRQYGSLTPKCYSYSDIKKMTNSFKEELGKGGYGTVYKGKLLDGLSVAVKILNANDGNDEDFINEVLSISRTSHVNIVRLLGFCIQGRRRALIYEYMENGSLEKYIHSEKNGKFYGLLRVDKLYEISLGVARGLEYLHRGCNTRILHFDIKPHNILLDEDFCPKISDFGMAKQCLKMESIVSILEVRGTIGYIAPELTNRCFGEVSYKSDVYSYGIMILEIIGQRKNVCTKMNQVSEVFLPRWVYQHMIIDKDMQLKGILTLEEDEIAKKIILVGLWCIQKDPSQRPTMSKVIEMLEGDLQDLKIPPKPFFDSPSTSSQYSFCHDVPKFSSTL